MGNCATIDSHLQEIYAEFRSCAPDSTNKDVIHTQPRTTNHKVPESYPTNMNKIFSSSNLKSAKTINKESILFPDSFVNEPEDLEFKVLAERKDAKIDESQEKVLDFKMLSVRPSAHSNSSSNSFTNHITKEEINEDSKSLCENNADKVSIIYENKSQPMNRDKMGYSYIGYAKNMRSPSKDEKKSVDQSVYFVTPFGKNEKNTQEMQPLSQKLIEFFTKTLEYLGPFDYSIKEEYFLQNPSFREFLQSVKTLPIEDSRILEGNTTYVGQWKNGQKNGRGQQIWSDGSVYEGYWFHNMAHGKGRLIHSQGTIYEGYWAFDQAHGTGLYFTVEGSIFQGNWHEDKQHGFGIEKWSNGAFYEGDYFMGMKHGKGKFKWEDGSCYQGDFNENLIQGKGKYHWNDGREYDGEWKANKMNGKGVFKWPDGKIYSGNYIEDEKSGIGVFFWPDGSLYKGFWENGKQHGKGKFIDRDGSVKEGDWINGNLLS